MRQLTAVDIFSGAGGLSYGLSQAGVHIALANELMPDMAKTHSLNHPNVRMINRDIHQVDFSAEIRDMGLGGQIDIVCGGPPCQGFSTVGKKQFTDPRNSLFGQFLRVIDEVEPSMILFENVSGFKKMYHGQIYDTLLTELQKRGFQTTSAVLNAQDYGLPQSRQRTVVLGWMDRTKLIQMPRPTHGPASSLPYLSLWDAISDLPPLCAGESSDHYFSAPQNEFQQRMRQLTQNLTEHNCAKYGTKMQQILAALPPGGCVHDLPLELQPKSAFSNSYARLLADRPAPTMTRNFGTPSSARCVHPFQNRALSTREGARLQGFPDHYQFAGAKISKNLQIGNAVPPIFGYVLAKALLGLDL